MKEIFMEQLRRSKLNQEKLLNTTGEKITSLMSHISIYLEEIESKNKEEKGREVVEIMIKEQHLRESMRYFRDCCAEGRSG